MTITIIAQIIGYSIMIIGGVFLLLLIAYTVLQVIINKRYAEGLHEFIKRIYWRKEFKKRYEENKQDDFK